MDEGELERQSLLPFMCRNHKQWVRRVNVRKAIDSAKKDFLQEIGEEGELYPEDLEIKFWTWFKKWFGEIQQTT